MIESSLRKSGSWLQSAGQLLRLPLQTLALLSKDKSFRSNPVLGNRLLNRLGLHLIRVVLAYAVTHFRWWILAPLAPPDERRRFQRDGFLVIPDFLPQQQFEAFAREAANYREQAWEMTQGDTLTQLVLLDEKTLADMPATEAVVRLPRFRRLIRYTGSYRTMPRVFLQRIANGFADGAEDPQKTLHKDTFHPTVKAWLFVDDVDAQGGPFTYVPTSHRLNRRRLAWEYRQSLEARHAANTHHANGSFRVSESDLRELGLPRPRAVTVKANTLVIANTVGFHCRGPVSGRVTRLELWSMSRKNPFNPWPGWDSRLYQRLAFRVVRMVVEQGQRRASRRGEQPIWRTTRFDIQGREHDAGA